MDLRHLEQIVAICRAGGFSGAARSLGITQPSLSRSIARLEASLSVKLFEREGGGAKPTAHGAFVARRAEALVRAAATLDRDLKLLVQGEAGRLRIGVGPVTGLKPLPQVIRAATAAFPRLQLETRHRGLRSVVKDLRKGRFDLVFCNAESAEPYGDLIRVKIYEDRYVAAVRPGHPALDQGPLSPAQLLTYPLASFGQPPSLKHWLGELTAEQQRNFLAFVSDDHHLVELPLTWPNRYECWMLTTEAHWRLPVVKAMADFAKVPNAGP